MRRNYRTKLGLGYDEAKFNYLNNSQFSCFYYKKRAATSHHTASSSGTPCSPALLLFLYVSRPRTARIRPNERRINSLGRKIKFLVTHVSFHSPLENRNVVLQQNCHRQSVRRQFLEATVCVFHGRETDRVQGGYCMGAKSRVLGQCIVR